MIYFKTKGGVSLWKFLAREWKPGSWFTPTSTASSLFQKVVRDGGCHWWLSFGGCPLATAVKMFVFKSVFRGRKWSPGCLAVYGQVFPLSLNLYLIILKS